MSNVEQILKNKNFNYKIHRYSHDEGCFSFAQEASDKLGVELGRIFKTLVVEGNNELFVGLIPSDRSFNLKALAKIIGAKKCSMGEKSVVEKSTGYVFGGISPIGQMKKLKTYIDSSALNFETIYVSAGNTGVEIEIIPEDLLKTVNGKFVNISK